MRPSCLILVCLGLAGGVPAAQGTNKVPAAKAAAAHAGTGPRVTELNLVTDAAATGSVGNAWGGHQCRIVRTRDGVFTAFIISGKTPMETEWRLARHRERGWDLVAGGRSGRDPINLLAAPDGTLHVVAWPDGRAHLWSITPGDGPRPPREESIPGLTEVSGESTPYGSAGIDDRGNLLVLSSEGTKPGSFRWALRDAASGEWATRVTPLDYRHCYTYVLLEPGGALSVVSTRDVRWEVLGYERPEGVFAYAFNALGFWRSVRADREPLLKAASLVEEPSKDYPNAFCNSQSDAYLDTQGRVHVLYRRAGASTGGAMQSRHAVFSSAGTVLADERIPAGAGPFCRIFQDDRGRFYLLGSSAIIYPVSGTDFTAGPGTPLDFQGYEVEYSGFGVAAPRTGTRSANVADVVFPSGGGRLWVYCRILLYESEEDAAPPPARTDGHRPTG